MALVNSSGSIDRSTIFVSHLMVSKHDFIPDLVRDTLTDPKLSASDRAALIAKDEICQLLRADHPPDVIAIAATCLRARRLFEVVAGIVSKSGTDIPIIFAPADAAIVYGRSALATHESRELSRTQGDVQLRLIAASVARRMQNPLCELTRLWEDGENRFLRLALHPLQGRLVRDGADSGPVFDACERACLRAVVISGVDVRSLNSEHHRGPLQFVSGLGPQWAAYILEKLNPRIGNRTLLHFDIFTPDKPIVTNSAISWMRFPGGKSRREDSDEKLLDGTFIHPDNYSKAKKLIHFFLNKPATADITEDDIVAFFTKRPRIDLDAYCNTRSKPRTRILELIVHELSVGPYETLRFERRSRPLYEAGMNSDAISLFKTNRARISKQPNNFYCPLEDRELFEMLVQHDPTLHIGACTELLVRRISDRGIRASHSTDFDRRGGVRPSEPSPVNRHGRLKPTDYSEFKLTISFDQRDSDEANQPVRRGPSRVQTRPELRRAGREQRSRAGED
jgi:hypothetical protein